MTESWILGLMIFKIFSMRAGIWSWVCGVLIIGRCGSSPEVSLASAKRQFGEVCFRCFCFVNAQDARTVKWRRKDFLSTLLKIKTSHSECWTSFHYDWDWHGKCRTHCKQVISCEARTGALVHCIESHLQKKKKYSVMWSMTLVPPSKISLHGSHHFLPCWILRPFRDGVSIAQDTKLWLHLMARKFPHSPLIVNKHEAMKDIQDRDASILSNTTLVLERRPDPGMPHFAWHQSTKWYPPYVVKPPSQDSNKQTFQRFRIQTLFGWNSLVIDDNISIRSRWASFLEVSKRPTDSSPLQIVRHENPKARESTRLDLAKRSSLRRCLVPNSRSGIPGEKKSESKEGTPC